SVLSPCGSWNQAFRPAYQMAVHSPSWSATTNCWPVTTLLPQSLFPDPALHSGGAPGSDGISDWGSSVVTGQQFVVADQDGEWTAIWYAGRKAWFHDPQGLNTEPAPGARIIRPKPGSAAVPVYSTAYPRPDEYPGGLTPSTQKPLGFYTLPQGQAYVSTAPPQQTDDFFRATPTRAETVVTGSETYDVIQYNHRLALVRHQDTQ
ncbi:hypothetical protein ACM614_17340, partial [Streptomyces sp. 12297]